MLEVKTPEEFPLSSHQSFSSTPSSPVMFVLLRRSQQLLDVLGDLLSFPNHIFCTGQAGAGGWVCILRDGALPLPNHAALPALPARPAGEQSRAWAGHRAAPWHPRAGSQHLPRLLQLHGRAGVVIVALRHAALLLQLRGLQGMDLFQSVQGRAALGCARATSCARGFALCSSC